MALCNYERSIIKIMAPMSACPYAEMSCTCIPQNYSRRHRVAIDALSFSTLVAVGGEEVADGVIIHGLFLEGAAFDRCAACARLFMCVDEWAHV